MNTKKIGSLLLAALSAVVLAGLGGPAALAAPAVSNGGTIVPASSEVVLAATPLALSAKSARSRIATNNATISANNYSISVLQQRNTFVKSQIDTPSGWY